MQNNRLARSARAFIRNQRRHLSKNLKHSRKAASSSAASSSIALSDCDSDEAYEGESDSDEERHSSESDSVRMQNSQGKSNKKRKACADASIATAANGELKRRRTQMNGMCVSFGICLRFELQRELNCASWWWPEINCASIDGSQRHTQWYFPLRITF